MPECKQLFIPITNTMNIQGGTNNEYTITIGGQQFKIKFENEYKNNAITKIYYDQRERKVFIKNVVVLVGYSITEDNKLVPTTDPCDFVRGIAIKVDYVEREPQALKFKIRDVNILKNKLYLLNIANNQLPDCKITLYIPITFENEVELNSTNVKKISNNDNNNNVDQNLLDFIRKYYFNELDENKFNENVKGKLINEIKNNFKYTVLKTNR